MKLCAWIGAVVDAHPTTISADGNEEYLVEALAVINSKVENFIILANWLELNKFQLELLSEYDTIEKLFMKNRRQQEQQTSGKYSVEILKLWMGEKPLYEFKNLIILECNQIKIRAMIGIKIGSTSHMYFVPILWRIKMVKRNNTGERYLNTICLIHINVDWRLLIGLALVHKQ